MLLDFCDGRLDPVVSCDKVSVDGYSIDNLISTDNITRNKGFIAEYFIRPPVNIKISFPFNIQIYRIVINPVVGSQKSTGFEIFTCCNKISQVQGHIGETPSVSTELFLPIGKAMLTEPSVICFQSVQFRVSDQWRPDNLPDLESYQFRRDLRHHNINHLNFVSQVMIRIFRTDGGSAACIRRLEIWGRPPSSCPQYIHDKIRPILFPSLSVAKTDDLDKDQSVSTDNSGSRIIIHEDEPAFENGVEIPEDFVDSITCEMMTVPMLLPCGKNIDQSTLDKQISAEASWGRPACDPFTGVLLDSKNQAIPNAHLKSRIDQFLLKHMDSLKHLPRTLGKNKDQANIPSSSRLVQSQNDIKSPVVSTSTDKSDSRTCLAKIKVNKHEQKVSVASCQDKSVFSTNSKFAKNQTQSQLKRNYVQNVNIDETGHIPGSSYKNVNNDETGHILSHTETEKHIPGCSHTGTEKHIPGCSHTGTEKHIPGCSHTGTEKHIPGCSHTGISYEPSHKKICHEDSLQQSLKFALDKTLGNLPTFKKSSLSNICHVSQDNNSTENRAGNETADSENKTGCVKCGTTETLAWYKITCGHLYCRNCLTATTSAKTMECQKCHNVCNKSDIVRVYQP